MRGWAALAWTLGLSPRSASHPLAAFGVSVSRMSARRDVQEAGRNARGKQAGGERGRVTVTGAVETVVRVNGVKTVVGVVADDATGEVLGLEVLVERDSDGFMERLGDFARDYGVETMVTDDLSAYKPVVERIGIEHQIRIARVRKRAWNRLDRIDGWNWIEARIWRLLTELPFDGDLELLRLERAVRDGDATLRRMRAELSGKWRAPLCRRRGNVPWTNSAAERAIGRSKIRYKTVRGYKSEDWMLNWFGLTRWAWSGRDGLDMSGAGRGVTSAAGWGSRVLRNPPRNDQPFLGRLRRRSALALRIIMWQYRGVGARPNFME